MRVMRRLLWLCLGGWGQAEGCWRGGQDCPPPPAPPFHHPTPTPPPHPAALEKMAWGPG